jgi:hypothetical protein
MDLTVVSIVGGPDIQLLPHWLAHYRSLGLERFALAVNDPGRASDYDRLLATAGLAAAFHLPDLFFKDEIFARGRLDAYAGEWILHADLDELFVFDRPLRGLVEACHAGGYEAVRGRFVDHLHREGNLPPVQASPSLWEQYPLMHPVTRYVRRGLDTKVVLRHRSVPVSSGNHTQTIASKYKVVYHPSWQEVHHFRWTASTAVSLRHLLEAWPACTHRLEVENVLRFLGEPPHLDLERLRKLAPFIKLNETLLGRWPHD